MELNKILVHDNQHYFARLLRHEFEKNFDFKVFKNFEGVDSFDDIENEYSIIVFVIYSDTDLFDFIRIYKKGVHVIVVAHNKAILKKMKCISDVLLFDASITRAGILEGISNLLSMYY